MKHWAVRKDDLLIRRFSINPDEIIRPPALGKGDLIALVSTGKAVSWAHDPATINIAVKALERDGYRVKVMPNARGKSDDGWAGTIEQRADDLNAAIADPQVRAIMGLVGGGGTLDVIKNDLIDWEQLRRDPKIFCGYSDFAILNIVAHMRLGLVTFDGPLAVFHFASLPKPLQYTSDSFYQIAGVNAPIGNLSRPQQMSCVCWEFTGIDDIKKRLHSASSWRWIHSGYAQGRLIKITPRQLTQLAEADLQPALANRLWCWDRITYDEDREYLMQVANGGLLEGIAGMIVGRPCTLGRTEPPEQVDGPGDFDAILNDLGDRFSIPVLADVDCGHTMPRLTLPNGVLATLDAKQNIFCIDEPAVS